MKYCFGVDVGGTGIKMGFFREDGSLIDKWWMPTRTGENGIYIYDDAAACVKEKMEEYGIEKKDLLGVGMDMPGPVYSDGRLGHAPNIFVNGGYPAEELSKRLGGVKTAVTNDANAAAFGEMWMGAGKGYGSLCLVTLGAGVGGGIIVDGQIVAGTHGAAGEIGHIKVEENETERCNCGGTGCCEFYASATGVVRVAKRMIASGDPLKPFTEGSEMMYRDSELGGLGKELTAKDVCDLAAEGDELAVRSLSFSMDKLARALACITYSIDPEVFVIGGGVSRAGETVLKMIREGILRYTPLIKEKDRYVISAELGNDAGIYGAAGLTIYNVF